MLEGGLEGGLEGRTEVLRPLADGGAGGYWFWCVPGGRMPVDGVVEVKGASEVDRGLSDRREPAGLCRWAKARLVSGGRGQPDRVLFTLRVTAAGQDSSSLHRMAELVAVAEAAKHPLYQLWPKGRRGSIRRWCICFPSAPLATGCGQTGGDMRFAVNISAAVLIITCPCALGLAVPAVDYRRIGAAVSAKGLLIKSRYPRWSGWPRWIW